MGETSSHVQGAATPVFQLGLALAGAISAGAYTAGVLDFLFQALSEWEKHRDDKVTPQHRVVLKVIAGASAGAITGALGAIALARGLDPREFSAAERAGIYPDRYDPRQPFQCVLPNLYKTWVTLPAMISADGVGGLLATDDLHSDANRPILRSVLNATLLDAIKRSAIEPCAEIRLARVHSLPCNGFRSRNHAGRSGAPRTA
jgi:hypothetical protein